MKKFLTVLLALSVVFTYSFSAVGTAFAADANTETVTTTHAEAMQQAQKGLIDNFNSIAAEAKTKLASSYTEAAIHAICVIEKSAYAATIDAIAADYAKIITIAAQQVEKAGNTSTSVAEITAAIEAQTVDDVIVYNNAKVAVTAGSFPVAKDSLNAASLVAYATTSSSGGDAATKYYMTLTLTNALDSMKASLNAEIAKIDMSQYTNDVATPEDAFKTTWAQKAETARQELLDTVSNTTINAAMNISDARAAAKNMYDVLNKMAIVKSVTGMDGKTVVISYKLADTSIKTAEDLSGDKTLSDANKASLKATVQSEAAKALKEALTTYNAANSAAKNDADKTAAKKAYELAQEQIAAYTDNRNVLIDENYIKTADRLEYTAQLGATCLDRQQKYEALEELAAIYKLQVEKDGSLKYVASIIDENLADAKPIVYNGDNYDSTKLIAGALNKASNLEWEKKVEIEKIKAEMNDVLDAGFYEPEATKVEAKYQALIDKVNAVTTTEQLTQVAKKTNGKYIASLGIDNKATVNSKVAAYLNTSNFMTAVKNYVDYLNIGIAPYADGYRDFSVSSNDDKDAVVKYLAKNGARTNADVAGLLGQAETYAKGIKTIGEIKDAKAAVDELVKAIPNYVTLADKPAVKAAYDAADAADYTPAKLTAAIAMVKTAEDKAIDDMIAALPKTITAADKAAVQAILDAIDVYESEDMYGYDDYDQKSKATAAFEAVRAAELANVENTIAALSLSDNPTKAQVEAARAVVDAFVEEYTDASEPPYQAISQITNLDKLTYLEAVVKANEVKAVEALKITASSTAKKGSITVKWTVKGDTSAVEGYEIWRSTKKNSGFSKFFTTTKTTYKNTKSLKKGTRYYYKVRAIAHVDGKKITSDWSNKAYRIAK